MSAPLKPIRKDDRFYNDEKDKPESLLWDTIPSLLRSLFVRKNGIPKDPNQWIACDPVIQSPEKSTITWIGHSTFLIQIHGINILTDPIFGSASFLYPRRLPPGITIDKLPRIDAVLISHNHHDHMDGNSLMQLKKQFPHMRVFVPLGDKPWFDQHGFAHAKEFDWEESTNIVNGSATQTLSCTFVPAHHWSQRSFFDKNKSLWGGWVIKTNETCIYFAGDSAYSKTCFKRITTLFNHIDVAMLPIAPVDPRDWMKHTHIDAHQAGQVFLDIGARHFIPMHWGTFGFGEDHFDAPIAIMKKWWAANSEVVAQKALHLLKVGQRFAVPPRSLEADIPAVEQPVVQQKQV